MAMAPATEEVAMTRFSSTREQAARKDVTETM